MCMILFILMKTIVFRVTNKSKMCSKSFLDVTAAVVFIFGVQDHKACMSFLHNARTVFTSDIILMSCLVMC